MQTSNLNDAIMRELRDFSNRVQSDVNELSDEVTKEAVVDLKSNSPIQTGSYRTGWTRKKTRTGFIVHNRTDYQLTHLLENGHAKVSGGRVAPKPHIQPIEQRAIEKFESVLR